MIVDVLNMEGQKVRTVELPDAIFDAPINVDLDAPGICPSNGKCPSRNTQN